ncbi:MAG: sigma-70 family RNA polymerase sigma factor [Oscillospiraceae bacterium]|nr:sigma-70 family RNA polymerase sigma factor [Oscillospiraceae bacterium]
MTLTAEQKKLVEENLGLVHSCANRFRGRGTEYEDLFQAGSVGLIKAAMGFNSELGFKFSTYAVPAILGEIKRIFRDGGDVKIGRASKEKALLLLKIKDELSNDLGREPSIGEIAKRAELDISEAACLISACMPAVSLTDDENGENDIPIDPPDEKLTLSLDLRNAIGKLNENDRLLLSLRYYKGLTQSVTAGILGMTQVQVSRKEKQILNKLKTLLN